MKTELPLDRGSKVPLSKSEETKDIKKSDEDENLGNPKIVN